MGRRVWSRLRRAERRGGGRRRRRLWLGRVIVTGGVEKKASSFYSFLSVSESDSCPRWSTHWSRKVTEFMAGFVFEGLNLFQGLGFLFDLEGQVSEF